MFTLFCYKLISTFNHFRNHTSLNGSEFLSNSLNLPLYTKLSQSVSHTLKSSAKEAEFYMKRHGKMKTASGSLAIGKKHALKSKTNWS